MSAARRVPRFVSQIRRDAEFGVQKRWLMRETWRGLIRYSREKLIRLKLR
jgi:hypothetical protein